MYCLLCLDLVPNISVLIALPNCPLLIFSVVRKRLTCSKRETHLVSSDTPHVKKTSAFKIYKSCTTLSLCQVLREAFKKQNPEIVCFFTKQGGGYPQTKLFPVFSREINLYNIFPNYDPPPLSVLLC